MKLEVNVAKTTVQGNEVLGTKDKNLYYLVLGEGENKYALNVGEKTYETVAVMIKPRETSTTINVFPPEKK